MTLTTEFAWLLKEPGPRLLHEAIALYGTRERDGNSDNLVILDWARELGIREYRSDSVAWCGLFVAICAKRAGWPVVTDPLGARNWLRFGVKTKPMLGDIIVFWRGKRTGFFGHVGIYVGETAFSYAVLGGNQGDRVSITWISKARFLGARRPVWKFGEPENRRQIFLKASGQLSTNEA